MHYMNMQCKNTCVACTTKPIIVDKSLKSNKISSVSAMLMSLDRDEQSGSP